MPARLCFTNKWGFGLLLDQVEPMNNVKRKINPGDWIIISWLFSVHEEALSMSSIMTNRWTIKWNIQDKSQWYSHHFCQHLKGQLKNRVEVAWMMFFVKNGRNKLKMMALILESRWPCPRLHLSDNNEWRSKTCYFRSPAQTWTLPFALPAVLLTAPAVHLVKTCLVHLKNYRFIISV